MENAKLILPTSWKPTCDEFLFALGMGSDGLAAQLFENVFDSFFANSIDLKREYERYYAVEYPTLSEYIEIRYGEKISDEELERDRILLVTHFPQVVDPNYEGNMLNTVLDYIEQKEKKHEG